MKSDKPRHVTNPPSRRLCPVCGKPSYSPSGIHPQCACRRMDDAERERLRRENQSP